MAGNFPEDIEKWRIANKADVGLTIWAYGAVLCFNPEEGVDTVENFKESLIELALPDGANEIAIALYLLDRNKQ